MSTHILVFYYCSLMIKIVFCRSLLTKNTTSIEFLNNLKITLFTFILHWFVGLPLFSVQIQETCLLHKANNVFLSKIKSKHVIKELLFSQMWRCDAYTEKKKNTIMEEVLIRIVVTSNSHSSLCVLAGPLLIFFSAFADLLLMTGVWMDIAYFNFEQGFCHCLSMLDDSDVLLWSDDLPSGWGKRCICNQMDYHSWKCSRNYLTWHSALWLR